MFTFLIVVAMFATYLTAILVKPERSTTIALAVFVGALYAWVAGAFGFVAVLFAAVTALHSFVRNP